MGKLEEHSYIFNDQAEDQELARLRFVEAAFDPRTVSLLEQIGIGQGDRCLELAAGGGSIARWMGQRVGARGVVTSVDLKTIYLKDLAHPPYRVVEGDAGQVDVGSDYDVAHCRYMLIHHPDPGTVLRRAYATLRPGGHILLEEPDFSISRALAGTSDGSQRVNEAIQLWFEQQGLDPAFGITLPDLAAQIGFHIVSVEADGHLCSGKSPVAKVMGASIASLREKYVATGVASEEDIQAYVEDAEHEDAWSHYYTTVRVVARKPETSS